MLVISTFQERFAKLREMALKKANLNQTYDKADTSQLNSTYTKDQTIQSYDITPARHELPPEPLIDQENYNIEDLKSDDDTDDEDNPRKVIPKWASGMISLHSRTLVKDVALLLFAEKERLSER